MKKLLTVFLMVASLSTILMAQEKPAETKATTSGPVMTLETTEIDYGTIEENSDGNRVFKFTNTGTEPLIVKNARGSCGCTVPDWPKEPIMPGESSVITVKYATNRVGPFRKTVTLTTNENGENSRVLTIKGTVNKKEEVPGVPEKSDDMFKGNKSN